MSGSYRDGKGRMRWRRNDEVAAIVRQLGEYLIIGGYPVQHAARYARIAHTISRHAECIDALAESGRLAEIDGVGGVITGYLAEITRTGTTAKFDDDQYGEPPPRSVLELTAIERLGAKTARTLYHEYGVDSLRSLCNALFEGRLDDVPNIGPVMRERIRSRCAPTLR